MKKIFFRPYRIVVNIAKKITDLDDVKEENKSLRTEVASLRTEKNIISEELKLEEKAKNFGWPNGHYYSPVHNQKDLINYKKATDISKKTFAKSIPGFSEKRILKEFSDIKTYFKDFNFPKNAGGNSRFFSNNVSLSPLDSLGIFAMIRKYKPNKIIEIGSGYSSGLMMEVNEKYFDSNIDITFIEPYPNLLNERMNKNDMSKYNIIVKGVQEVPLEIFKTLKKNDILFIDSTHVSKFNSDVNYELFNILPVISKGVIIHIHDIHDGFEYPLNWLKQGWAWNEAYLLRAFLMNNNEYEVLLANNFIKSNHPSMLLNIFTDEDKMYLSNGEEIIRHDGSMWIRKI